MRCKTYKRGDGRRGLVNDDRERIMIMIVLTGLQLSGSAKPLTQSQFSAILYIHFDREKYEREKDTMDWHLDILRPNDWDFGQWNLRDVTQSL